VSLCLNLSPHLDHNHLLGAPGALCERDEQLTQDIDERLDLPSRSISPHRLSGPRRAWNHILVELLTNSSSLAALRMFSTSTGRRGSGTTKSSGQQCTAATSGTTATAPKLTHLTATGEAHMVDINAKNVTKRSATAVCSVHFSNPVAAELIRSNQSKKGDVLGVARLAGIMASKRTADLIPLCHPIAITHVTVDVTLDSDSDVRLEEEIDTLGSLGHTNGTVHIRATVACEGKTGVEMEALTAASVAALTVYDMCKAVDKGMKVEGLRVVKKEGGKSGTWVEGDNVS
jgi:molybdenum cofactor biosynthesis protein MoaC